MSMITQRPANNEPAMFSIAGFCRSHGISRSFFYKLQKRGKAPAISKLGSRRLITLEAAAAWRVEMNQETA